MVFDVSPKKDFASGSASVESESLAWKTLNLVLKGNSPTRSGLVS
jgi:hypothetical protein